MIGTLEFNDVDRWVNTFASIVYLHLYTHQSGVQLNMIWQFLLLTGQKEVPDQPYNQTLAWFFFLFLPLKKESTAPKLWVICCGPLCSFAQMCSVPKKSNHCKRKVTLFFNTKLITSMDTGVYNRLWKYGSLPGAQWIMASVKPAMCNELNIVVIWLEINEQILKYALLMLFSTGFKGKKS